MSRRLTVLFLAMLVLVGAMSLKTVVVPPLATFVRHSLTNVSRVMPDFGGILAAVFTRSRYGWKAFHAARSDMLLTGPSKTHRRTRLNVPFACRTSSRYMP